jgi:hypothetical protein
MERQQMQNFNSGSFSGNNNFENPIPPNDDTGKAIPFDDGSEDTNVSHSPLNLGSGGTMEQAKPAAKESPRPAAVNRPQAATKKAPQEAASSSRITGVKTFFTKLHPGAINFLDEQIAKWLKENPGVSIKRTNMIMGEIQAKKTEPNLIMTVWY